MMKVSEAFGGIGSEAISAVPVFEKTKATWGKWLTAFSTSNCIAWDWVSAGTRNAQCMHGDVLFVEGRDELLAKPLKRRNAAPKQE